MSYFPYDGQNGALSHKNIGRDKELVYTLRYCYIHCIC